MANQRSTLNTKLPVQLLALDGTSIPATAIHIALQYQDSVGSCEMTLEVGGATAQAILEQEWFHLFASARLDQASFEPDRPVRLLVSLRPAIVRKLAAQGLDAEDVFNALLPNADAAALPLSVPLKQAESWLAIELKQELALPEELTNEGTISIGLRTNWREKLAVGPGLREGSGTKSSVSLYAQMESYLSSKGLKAEPINEELMKLRFHAEEAEWGCVVQVDEDARLLVLYSVFPHAIPAPLREETALAFMGENYGSLLGNYEMDTEDGELRYRSTIPAGPELDYGILSAVLAEHLNVMRHFIPIIADVSEQNGL
ncbi:hypothetical protein [Cohnella sp. AR92]|uniref:hypothetical protein n=1 Tax=Cohnella sp. AR92 TaxID=648716 RepID=UPI000F8D6144|nr:hypothetical protein [Cohnella sp. AR92]RUS45914.1 hypothetical protein ELR57_15790 [Cohnella sp. AR92]